MCHSVAFVDKSTFGLLWLIIPKCFSHFIQFHIKFKTVIMFPFKTCLFGYPLKQGVYTFLTIELVIGLLSVLTIFYQGEINLKGIITVMVSTVMVLISALGLYGVKEEKPSHISSYVIVQLILVVVSVLGIIGLVLTLSLLSLIPSLLTTAILVYALLVAASYQKEIDPGQAQPPSDIP